MTLTMVPVIYSDDFLLHDTGRFHPERPDRLRAIVELLKAAQARFLQGNLAGADDFYSQFENLRRTQRDPLVDIRKAEWLYVTGRKAQAIAAAEAASRGTNSEINAYALCHLSLWAVDSGDRAKAADLVARAAQARCPGIHGAP